MKFVADVMLGKLAKRLRLLGFDVLYDRSWSDREIIRFSLEQHRVILSRDKQLVERPLAGNHCFIKSDYVRDQLEQVIRELSLCSCETPLTRCSECNSLLVPVRKRDLQDIVPHYVYENNNEFLHCRNCGRNYWKGTHLQNMHSINGSKALACPGQQD